jgi:hypothetical protein
MPRLRQVEQALDAGLILSSSAGILQISQQVRGLLRLSSDIRFGQLLGFQLVFEQTLDSLFIERMELNEELFTDSMSKPDVRALITSFLGNLVSKKLADQEIEYSRIIEPSIQQVFLLDLGVRFTNDRGAGVKSSRKAPEDR